MVHGVDVMHVSAAEASGAANVVRLNLNFTCGNFIHWIKCTVSCAESFAGVHTSVQICLRPKRHTTEQLLFDHPIERHTVQKLSIT